MKHFHFIIVVFCLTGFLLPACSAAEPAELAPATPDGDDGVLESVQGEGRPRLEDVTRWFYMIDVNLEQEMIAQMAASEYDLIVLDFIPSEANNTDFPMAEVIDELHQADHSKLVLAYIDVGQAESFRTYWQAGWSIGDPQWIAGEDPDGWAENYPVAF